MGRRCAGAIGVAAIAYALVACGATAPSTPAVDRTDSAAPVTHTAPPRRTPGLARWRKPVEEIFVHPLVLDPRAAFTDDTLGRGFQDYFVTAREFRILLDQLWRNGWTLVDVHRAARGNVLVPRGRKPLVLVEDDVNYYRYFDGRGLAARLVLDGDTVRAQLPDGSLSDEDVVPLVEAEVAAHPEFSAQGARGVLAVTGYEGLLGEHSPDLPAARARLIALASRLRQTGWTFASHTYGHLDLSRNAEATILTDLARWEALARPLLGPVDILVYPYGARPSPPVIADLARAGYPIQLDIDVIARRDRLGGATLMSRRHVDGLAFDVPERQRPFYDVATVRDPRRPPG
jgi:Polysaccharide deacetylase